LSKPRLEAGQRRGTRIPCEGTEVLPIRRRSGGSQKPFSSLSEGVRTAFIIYTETSETACALHLKIPNVVLTSPEQFARENQLRVQRYRE
jgi:hypothetical protein